METLRTQKIRGPSQMEFGGRNQLRKECRKKSSMGETPRLLRKLLNRQSEQSFYFEVLGVKQTAQEMDPIRPTGPRLCLWRSVPVRKENGIYGSNSKMEC